MKKKKYMKLTEFLFILLIVFALIIVFYVGIKKTETLKKPDKILEDNKTIEITECIEEQTKECITENGCDGKQYCKNGEWTACYKNDVICKPGSTTTCAINPCTAGIKTCNDCGTGWGECINQ